MLEPRFPNCPELFDRRGNPWVSKHDQRHMLTLCDPPVKRPKFASMKQVSVSRERYEDLEFACREARMARLAGEDNARKARTALAREFDREDAPERAGLKPQPYVDKLEATYIAHAADTAAKAHEDWLANERATLQARRNAALSRRD